MPYVTADDGTRLWVETAGSGRPLVFVHEFAGEAASWEPQLRFFARRYQCVAFCARGYPPSEVPEAPERYGQDRARDDIRDVVRGLGLERPHVVGLSMGAFATLHFGLAYPELAAALVVAGVGYGAPPDQQAQFRAEAEAAAERVARDGMAEMAPRYAAGPARVQLRDKDPRGWEEFARRLAAHDPHGAAMTLRRVQARRPSLYDLEAGLRGLPLPTLVIAGDEDEPALDASLWLKRTIPGAGLAVLPRAGHTLNLEEPAAFNALCLDFFHQVETGRWASREAPAGGAILGLR
jgi:pimeloyl-ACP methyl ester carboxylesterase